MHMHNKIYFTILIFLICFNALAQPDCVIPFKYKGIIISDSIKTSKVGLPTTPYLIGYEKKSDEKAFLIYELKDTIINEVLYSHLSSDFCRSLEDIITYFFKKTKNGYLIKIYTKQNKGSTKSNPIEILISLESIKFTIETIDNRKGIVIDFGKIKI